MIDADLHLDQPAQHSASCHTNASKGFTWLCGLCRFAFEHGPVQFIVFSTEHYFHNGSKQYEFFKHTLAAVDRRRTPWLVVGGHRPFYIDSIDDSKPGGDQFVAQQMRDALEDLYMQYGVDLTLHGHHHSYQRTCPVYQGSCRGYTKNGVANAPVHVVIGNAGASLSYDVHREQPKVWRYKACTAKPVLCLSSLHPTIRLLRIQVRKEVRARASYIIVFKARSACCGQCGI